MMAATPQWKVYSPQGEYVAACKHLEDAAALVALYGSGASISEGHGKKLWTEGQEDQPAGESYDHVRETVLSRRPQPRHTA